jgi:SH3-like domain-containing protein
MKNLIEKYESLGFHLSVKNEPRVSGSDVFVLHEGTKVFVEEALENWKKIQLTDGTEGWIEESAIREVKQ